MAEENPTGREERIANELKRKLTIQVKVPPQRRSGPRSRPETALADLRPQSLQSDRGLRFLRGDHLGRIRKFSAKRHCPSSSGADSPAVPRNRAGDHPCRFLSGDRDRVFSEDGDQAVHLSVRVLADTGGWSRRPVSAKFCETD
jgi:hypothetical protein